MNDADRVVVRAMIQQEGHDANRSASIKSKRRYALG